MCINVITTKKEIITIMKNPSNEIFINKIRESLQFSSLIYSPIFMPTARKKEKSKEKVKVEIKRTDWEEIIYEGELLNLGFDFELFSIIVSKAQQCQSTSIVLTERELIVKGLKEKISTKLKNRIFERLEEFQSFRLKINKSHDDGTIHTAIRAVFIQDISWDKNNNLFNIKVSKHFMSCDISGLPKELILLDDFKAFDKEQERALFLYLETKKFKNKRRTQKIVTHHVVELIARVCPNYKNYNDARDAVTDALNTLKKAGYLKEFTFSKRERDDEPLCNTTMTHTFSKTRPAYVEKRELEKAKKRKKIKQAKKLKNNKIVAARTLSNDSKSHS